MAKHLLSILILWVFVAPAMSQASQSFALGGATYVHRWSGDNQHEFTPQGQHDLRRWSDMLTINVFPAVQTGEDLARVANGVLSNYQNAGGIVRTASKPRTQESEAEHLIVAILRGDGVMEGVHARIKFVQGRGTVAVWARREYGADAAAKIGSWLQENGQAREIVFMAWDGYPVIADLGQ